MRPLSLFGVLVLAKVLVLWDREFVWTAWTPLALVWQDLLIVALYAALELGRAAPLDKLERLRTVGRLRGQKCADRPRAFKSADRADAAQRPAAQ